MGTQLPTYVDSGKSKAIGHTTPTVDKSPQTARVLPNRAIPIIFIPGIMGSNLRMSRERQQTLGKGNNIAWRPDRKFEMLALLDASPAERQMQLDPATTEVDTYDDGAAPTGSRSESAAERQDNGRIWVTLHRAHPLLLEDDPPTVKPHRTREQKALERGWGEVYFGSYRAILERCEQSLNSPNGFGSIWSRIIGADPASFGAVASPLIPSLTESEFKETTKECMFPVHAMGYNWLHSIERSSKVLAARIERLIGRYLSLGIQCEKVIVVTHSMGGLVGRALVHPHMGNIESKILGVIHGVQPALGAPAAYKRMRCGFEEGFLGAAPGPKILGNHGSEVTAVLGNSVGGLQLLPSCAYGNGWLQIQHNGAVIDSWPKNGDPYAEIYCIKDKWYGLLREEWLNPAQERNAGFDTTCRLLLEAKRFHLAIEHTYHPQTYAHYCADPKRRSWATVTWIYEMPIIAGNWKELVVADDDQRGHFSLNSAQGAERNLTGITVKLAPSEGAGDQTVPIRSSDHQLTSGKCKAIFRQTGYEHQASYDDVQAFHATLFSIIKIASTMRWASK